MAAGDSHILTQLCEEFLSCDICMEVFDTDTRSPRILQCFHSFCASCLSQWSGEGWLTCPKCMHKMPVEGPIPMDTTKLALLEFKQMVSQEGPACQGCSEGGRGKARCQECEQYLCAECCQAHRKMNIFRNHSLLPLSEAMQAPTRLLKVSQKCDRHGDKKLELFCSSCVKAVCILCSQTEHRGCKQVVELDSILDMKRKELLQVCEQLERIEATFQAKCVESDASLKEVDRNLKEGEQRAREAFFQLISTAQERQAVILGELKAKAETDHQRLREQAAEFQALKAAAQTSAQYGRRVLTLDLAPPLLDQKLELEKKAVELRKKTTLDVWPAPPCSFQIAAEKLEELKTRIQKFGETEAPTAADAAARRNQHLPVTCPPFALDATLCGPECCVDAGGHSLSYLPTARNPDANNSKVFKIPGTCGTTALSLPAFYWQVRCVAIPKPQFKEEHCFCEMGVLSEQALADLSGTDWMSQTDHCAVTVGIATHRGCVKAWARHSKQELRTYILAPYSPHRVVEETLGFLLDGARRRLHILNMGTSDLLWSTDVDLSTPLWPVFRVEKEEFCGGGAQLELQTGQQVDLTEDMVRLLQSALNKVL